MYYVLQENLYREFAYPKLIECLKANKLEYEVVPWRPFTDHEIGYKATKTNVFFFGSVLGARKAMAAKWTPGSFYNDSHDFEIYAPQWWPYMLNKDARIIELGDDPQMEAFFMRPTKDTKTFRGEPTTLDAYNAYVAETKQNNVYEQIKAETKVLVAPLKDGIQQEIRCWIVDGEPVTISQYKIGRRVVYQNHDNNEEAYIFAKQMTKFYNPARAYVLDICLYEDEYKIMEVNCINCSGFYDADMCKLIKKLEQTFNINES